MSHYIDPIAISADQILAGTSLAEDPTPAWAAGTYAIGYECHVVDTHRVYRRTLSTASTVRPDQDPSGWVDVRPTNRWAPFDEYTDTPAESASDIVYVLRSRFVNALNLRGLVGTGVKVVIKDQTGGEVLFQYPEGGGLAQLKRPARGYYDYAFGDRKYQTTLVLRNLPMRANAEITITVTASAGQPREIGMIVRGKFRTLQGLGIGGVQEDAQVIPKTYTEQQEQPDGRMRTTVRGSSTDLSFSIVMEREYADQAVQALQDLLSKPVAWFVSTQSGFAGLSTFGIAQRSPVRYRNRLAYIDMQVKGYV
ncbi:hypothetical protein [Acidovorax sp. Leaf160]|uniref:hypothetical protein n=1 Tax=Acidovorax sp. Leaf160 TaxID=1736280 RepID=UPI0006FF0C93|nr:hypothetical protein [Acidovorax sp. Leaf160]KQR62661.1 hypothetical protein ASF94_15700 [Acidovorax sp. Leaf160]